MGRAWSSFLRFNRSNSARRGDSRWSIFHPEDWGICFETVQFVSEVIVCRANRLNRFHREVNRTDRYLHWDKLRHKPCPDGVTAEERWAVLKMKRMLQ